MTQHIALWANMYANKPPWLSDTTKSMNLPAAIANEIARLVTVEFKSEVTGSNERARYLNEQYQKVLEDIRVYTEYGCAKGGLVFKPYINGEKIAVEYVQADNFYPIRFGSDGTITAAAFLEQKTVGNIYYTRIEYHDFDGTKETIVNKAFKSTVKDTIGHEVNLTAVDDWKDLQPVADINGIDAPLFSYFKVPTANNVDTYSPLGASVFSRATDGIDGGLIHEADVRYSQNSWEFESAERAVDIDVTAFRLDRQGKPIIPERQQRLFRTNRAEKGNESFYEVFSPDIRDEAHKRSLNQILRQIEFAVGLAYGTLSDPEQEAKTATEVNASKQRSYSTVHDIQKSLQKALEQLVYIMDVYSSLYELSPKGSYNLEFEWDDSIIVDDATERLKDKEDLRDGIMSKLEYRMKWYKEDKETAAKALAEAQENQPQDEMLNFDI